MSDETTGQADIPADGQQPADGTAEDQAAQELLSQWTADDGQDTADDTTDDGQATEPNREAARYRTRLRDAEAQRDGLQTQLDAARAQIVAHHAAARLQDPADLDRFDVDTAGLWADDGSLDTDALGSAIDGLLQQRPELAARKLPAPWSSDAVNNAPRKSDKGPTWADALKRR